MKITQVIPEMLGALPPALRLRLQEIHDGWTNRQYYRLAKFQAAISDGGARFLSQDLSRWCRPKDGGVFTIEYLRTRPVTPTTRINIYAGSHRILPGQFLHPVTLQLLKSEPLNPTARVMAANMLSIGALPEELITWEQIKDWLEKPIEVELPPIPQEVIDAAREGVRIECHLHFGEDGIQNYTRTGSLTAHLEISHQAVEEAVVKAAKEGLGLAGASDILENAARLRMEKEHPITSPTVHWTTNPGTVVEVRGQSGPLVAANLTSPIEYWVDKYKPDLMAALAPKPDTNEDVGQFDREEDDAGEINEELELEEEAEPNEDQ